MFLRNAASFFATHRILFSRFFGVAFFLLVLASGSAHGRSVLDAVLFLSGLVLVGIATVGRLWCSLYISGYKDRELITTGPYSLSRNPLYFFSFLGFAGIGLATETITLAVALPAMQLAAQSPEKVQAVSQVTRWDPADWIAEAKKLSS